MRYVVRRTLRMYVRIGPTRVSVNRSLMETVAIDRYAWSSQSHLQLI